MKLASDKFGEKLKDGSVGVLQPGVEDKVIYIFFNSGSILAQYQRKCEHWGSLSPTYIKI